MSYTAHIVIEAQTPLKVGSNSSDFLQDAPIQRDWNNLPMILGTSIAGVLRKDFEGDVEDIFGQENGSKVIISNALLVDENHQVCENLLLEKSPFLKLFETLPIREHTAITEKGVAKERSKFDEEVVYKGTRFKFSITLIESDENTFNEILKLLSRESFRLGGGSTKGFGAFEVVEITTTSKACSSSLNTKLSNPFTPNTESANKYTKYMLKITPDDFFMFGSGFGDEEADMTPVYEKVVDYEKRALSKKQILIPASSIKGALAHRTTYHYNLQNELFVGNTKARESIKEIFGEAKNSKEKIEGSKGKLLLSDCFKEEAGSKVFDHVSIDRFTGGTIDGALFKEKTIADSSEYLIEVLLEKSVEEQYVKAFEEALKEIKTGLLPLGGATTKGHGVFSGTLYRDGEIVC